MKMSNTAIITGGSKRIGKSIALTLADMGYNIALHYNRSRKDALALKKILIKKGVDCEIFKADLANPSEARVLIKDINRKMKGISLLVNNASVFYEKSFINVKEKDFDTEFNINFKSPFFLSQQFAKQVSEGMIINLLDARVSKVHTAHFVYNLTKNSLMHFTLMLAKELGPEIRVNAICPGPILPADGESITQLKKIAAKTPLKKIGDTSYINSGVRYLVENKFITGEMLYIQVNDDRFYNEEEITHCRSSCIRIIQTTARCNDCDI